MDSTKEFKRTHLPFSKPIPLTKQSKEILVNNVGQIRAVLDKGVIIVQVKKHTGNQREVVRINTNVTPLTIELVMEKTKA